MHSGIKKKNEAFQLKKMKVQSDIALIHLLPDKNFICSLYDGSYLYFYDLFRVYELGFEHFATCSYPLSDGRTILGLSNGQIGILTLDHDNSVSVQQIKISENDDSLRALQLIIESQKSIICLDFLGMITLMDSEGFTVRQQINIGCITASCHSYNYISLSFGNDINKFVTLQKDYFIHTIFEVKDCRLLQNMCEGQVLIDGQAASECATEFFNITHEIIDIQIDQAENMLALSTKIGQIYLYQFTQHQKVPKLTLMKILKNQQPGTLDCISLQFYQNKLLFCNNNQEMLIYNPFSGQISNSTLKINKRKRLQKVFCLEDDNQASQYILLILRDNKSSFTDKEEITINVLKCKLI